MKLTFLTVIPSPYQRELFDKIAASKSISLQVIYYSETEISREWKKPELKYYEEVLPGFPIRLGKLETWWNWGVIERLSRYSPDLVVVSDYSAPAARIAMRWLTRNQIPWIYWGELPGLSKGRMINDLVRNRLMKILSLSTAIVGIGTVAKSEYKRLFPKVDVYSIPYYCDLSRYIEIAQTRAWDESAPPNILFSGQMIPRKGVATLLDSLKLLKSQGSEFTATFLGSGDWLEFYKRYASPVLDGAVNFVGHVAPDRLECFFKEADIFCLPSFHDGWGVVVNEALGAGLPIVASTSVRAAIDLVEHGENGFLFEAGNERALAEYLGKLINEASLRRQFSAKSLQKAPLHNVDVGANKWLDLAFRIARST